MKRRIVALLVSLALCAAAFPGCATTAEPSSSASEEETASATATAEATEERAEEASAPEGEESADASATEDAQDAEGETRLVTDGAGRDVEIPASVEKVVGTNPVGSIYTYTLAPEKLAAWNYKFNDSELKYIADECKDLPIVGQGQNFNLEAVLSVAPDVILQMGGTGDSAVEQADDMQEQTQIPVLVYSQELVDTPQVLIDLGEVLGVEDEAEQLSAEATEIMSLAEGKAATVPDADRATVYYGNGPESLNTAPQGSDAAEVLELAGGVNCAAIQLDAADGASERVDISKEQLLAWDPDVIFVNGEPKEGLSAQSAADTILQDPDYAALKAVRNGRVYGIPQTPFSWIDRPKSDNRVIGVLWAGAMMYPELYGDVDVTQQIQDFYDLFYHVALTDEEVAMLPNG